MRTAPAWLRFGAQIVWECVRYPRHHSVIYRRGERVWVNRWLAQGSGSTRVG